MSNVSASVVHSSLGSGPTGTSNGGYSHCCTLTQMQFWRLLRDCKIHHHGKTLYDMDSIIRKSAEIAFIDGMVGSGLTCKTCFHSFRSGCTSHYCPQSEPHFSHEGIPPIIGVFVRSLTQQSTRDQEVQSYTCIVLIIFCLIFLSL